MSWGLRCVVAEVAPEVSVWATATAGRKIETAAIIRLLRIVGERARAALLFDIECLSIFLSFEMILLSEDAVWLLHQTERHVGCVPYDCKRKSQGVRPLMPRL